MGHNTHTTTHALLLVSLVFLLVRRRVDGGPAVVSSRRLCNHKQCFVAVPERYDFEGSREQCKERTGGGHLMTVQSPDLHKDLVRLLRGHYTGNYWIGLQLPVDKCPDSASPLRGYRWIIDDKATDFNNWGPASSSSVDALCAHRCVSVGSGTDNNSTWAQETCDTVTEGFICEYPLVEPCAPLAHSSAEYTVYAMPELRFDEASAAYPQGTIAVERPSGFKHICAEHRWIPAPWSCDVLNGGCGDVCRDHACACSAPGSTLRANNVTCSAPALPGEELEADPCSGGDGYLAAAGEDREGCVDVDMKRGNNECLDRDGCAGDGERPEECAEGYVLEDGVCVSVEICDKCEHMKCELSDGVYQCFCRNGFVVWDKDPTRCLQHCDRRDCPSNCIEPSDPKEEPQCYCPGGYIQDRRNGTSVCTDIDECEQARQCDHTCVNTYGSYTCLCDAGFDLYLGYKCIAAAGGGDDGSGGGGSTSTSHYISASNAISPTVIPPYIKTGSVLGIVVFVALFVGLSCFVVHRALRRCRTFEIASSLRGADHVQDIFHLQQVMTEKYKRFSFDKQWDNNDHQRQ